MPVVKKTQSRAQIKRVGIFGGSFDPPHVGHLVIAQQAADQLLLDRVFFVPAHQAPHKLHGRSSEARHRLAMTRRAIKGNHLFRVSDLEIAKKGISYTIDTLNQFQEMFPNAELFLIIGGDSLEQFQEWRQPDIIRSIASLAVYPRQGNELLASGAAMKGVTIIRGPMIDISSTDIRRMVSQGRSIRYLVAPEVRAYIIQRHLYAR